MKISNRKLLVDNFSIDELKEIVQQCDSWRGLCRAIGYNSHSGQVIQRIKLRLEQYNISTEHFTSSHGPIKTRRYDDVLVENTTAADNTVRTHYYNGNYSEYKCSICGLQPFWNGKELTLTLDHINGNHFDSRPQNLRWVCPNCDRQLPTFGGRNHKYKIK